MSSGTSTAEPPDGDDARRLIDEQLETPLSEEEFSFLVLQGTLAEIKTAAKEKQRASLVAATRTIRNLRAAQGKPTTGPLVRPGRMSPEEGRRRYAVSRLLAIEAGRSPEVMAFREKYGCGALAWEGIQGWIQDHAQADGPYSQYVEVALPDGTQPGPGREGLVVESDTALRDLRMGNRVWANMLNYGVPGGKWVRRIPVRSAGVLDELRELCLSLQKDYGWTEDQGCVFVLTGITPYLPGIHLETVVQGENPAASRITLVIDPVVAPQVVLDSYGRLRQKVLMGRYRPLSEKHLKLAVFAAERRPPASWAEVMELWNAEHEEDRYTVETTFARDCAAAQRRLLKPKLNPDGLEELVAEGEE